MEIVNHPSVYLLQKTHVDAGELERFKSDFAIQGIGERPISQARSHAELACEFAGRLCYWSFDNPRPGGNAAYLDRIKSEGHGSVLEHAVYTFVFTGISRTLTHELVRHRAGWAYSQLSQRYVDESECRFVRPVEIQPGTTEYGQWVSALEYLSRDYSEMVRMLFAKFKAGLTEAEAGNLMLGNGLMTTTELRKRARQAARSILPGCTETRIVATANARALRHFLEQRGSKFAEPEIRRLANRVLHILQLDSPNIFGDYLTRELPDGTSEISTATPKV